MITPLSSRALYPSQIEPYSLDNLILAQNKAYNQLLSGAANLLSTYTLY
jgi:hypothetical protein